MTVRQASSLQIESALQLCSQVRYPSWTERKHVRGVGTFFLVAAYARGCHVLHNAWEFNLATFYDSPNRQIKVLAKFSGYTVLLPYVFQDKSQQLVVQW